MIDAIFWVSASFSLLAAASCVVVLCSKGASEKPATLQDVSLFALACMFAVEVMNLAGKIGGYW